jgi:hypothetical protein
MTGRHRFSVDIRSNLLKDNAAPYLMSPVRTGSRQGATLSAWIALTFVGTHVRVTVSAFIAGLTHGRTGLRA